MVCNGMYVMYGMYVMVCNGMYVMVCINVMYGMY